MYFERDTTTKTISIMRSVFKLRLNSKKRYLLSGAILFSICLVLLRTQQQLNWDHTQQDRHLKQAEQQLVEVLKTKKHDENLRSLQKVDKARASAGEEDNEMNDGHDHGHYIVDIIESPADSSLHKGHSDLPPNITKTNKSAHHECLEWTRRAPKPPFFLTAVLLVRIYKADKAKLTNSELKMWLEYLRYAGFEHVYVYDAWVYEDEAVLGILKPFQDDGYITYEDWHTHNPYTIAGTQVAAYQDCINKYKNENEWQAAIDIDEYPFSPRDTAPGFLYRYMKDYSNFHPDISELTMHNFLYLGKPLEKELMIERLLRRTPNPANPLVKPIYKSSNVRAQVHHNGLLSGRSMNAPSAELRMNHYWGARLQKWGEDTPEILAKTVLDTGIQPIITAFKECESYIRPYL